ncbi:cation:proton antiporter [Candidatus Woesearchaeota archaeon]|nr:cation:proton antiporter [Candidatus Woesearchaeota archaeon]
MAVGSETYILFMLLISLSVTYLLTKLFIKVHIPRVLAPLMVGMYLGIPWVENLFFNNDSLGLMNGLSNLGLILLLFYVGLGINLKEFKDSSRQMFSVAFFSAFLPFILGFAVTLMLGYEILPAFVMGAVLSVTSEGGVLALLKREKILSSRIGRIIAGAGLIDDVIEILIIAILSFIITSAQISGGGFLVFIVNFALFFGFLVALKLLFIPWIMTFLHDRENEQKYDLFTAAIILVILIAIITNMLQLGLSLGALLAGVLVKYALEKKGKQGFIEEAEIDDMIHTITFGFMALFFFIWVGMHTDIAGLYHDPWLALVLTILALAGKWVGSVIGFMKTGYGGSFFEANMIGWGMNSRGAMELVAAEIARTHGLISIHIFSAIVFMAFVTTFLSPIVFHLFIILRKYKKI